MHHSGQRNTNIQLWEQVDKHIFQKKKSAISARMCPQELCVVSIDKLNTHHTHKIISQKYFNSLLFRVTEVKPFSIFNIQSSAIKNDFLLNKQNQRVAQTSSG